MPTMNQTAIYFSLAPRTYASQSNNSGGYAYDVFGNQVDSKLYSCNQDMNIQVLWKKGTTLLQDHEGTGSNNERIENDLVNVLFDIYEMPCHKANAQTVSIANGKKICTIRKSKDIPAEFNGWQDAASTVVGHRFTVNIAPILNNLLSYSLVPPGIGTWGGATDGSTGMQDQGSGQRNIYGGLNGQWVMNNIVSTSNQEMLYNFEVNGTCRRIAIRARFELYGADGSLVLSTSPSSRSVSDFWIYNGANQITDRASLGGGGGQRFQLTGSSSSNKTFMTYCPNGQQRIGGSTTDKDELYFKKIRATDNADYLQWFQSTLLQSSNPTAPTATTFAVRIESSASKTFTSSTTVYLVDCVKGQRAERTGSSSANYRWVYSQYRTFVQNVAPAYVNLHNNGSQAVPWTTGTNVPTAISSSKPYYRACVIVRESGSSSDIRVSEFRYFELDESPINEAFSNIDGMGDGVKFMWLNRAGGIDSYTAKRNITSGLDVSQNTITKQTPYSRFQYDFDTDGYSPSSRGLADMYPHSREVLNVDANKQYTVFTDPLNAVEAKWIEELYTSPNVWVVKENTRQEYVGSTNDMKLQKPGDKSYVPVLITNSSTTTVDENAGLVQAQIEFIESNKINTQSN